MRIWKYARICSMKNAWRKRNNRKNTQTPKKQMRIQRGVGEGIWGDATNKVCNKKGIKHKLQNKISHTQNHSEQKHFHKDNINMSMKTESLHNDNSEDDKLEWRTSEVWACILRIHCRWQPWALFPWVVFVASMWLVLSRFGKCLVLCSYIKGASWFSIDIYLFFCDCHIVFHILFFCSILSKLQLSLLRSSPFNLSSLACVQGLVIFHGFCILWSFVSLIICNSAWPVQCEIRITPNTIGLWNPFLIYAPIMTICLNVPLWGLLFFQLSGVLLLWTSAFGAKVK